MKKKLLAVLLSVIMVAAVLQPLFTVSAASPVWTGGISTPTLSGGYYLINTAEKLAWFANQVNAGSASLKARLTDDIMLNITGSNSNEWIPIGTEAKPFKGEFDGDGHYISGVYIRTLRDYNGLFGYVYSPKPYVDDEDDTTEEIFTPNPPVMIHDVTVKNSSIKGLDNTGGICGYIHYGVIKGCSFSGTVNSLGNSVGGVCGYAFNFSRIIQCSSSGSVTGVIRTGGIVGYSNGNTRINECYSEASVLSNASVNGNSGGIVGALSASTLKGCYFTGSISGPKRIGGIIGYNSYSTITSCYVLGSVSSTTGAADGIGAITGYTMGCYYYNCYFCEDNTTVGDVNGTARTLEDMKKFSFVRELNENASAFSFDYMVINNGYPVLVFMLETSVWSGGVEEPATDSSGTYLIETADNLAWFSKLVNGTLAGVERNSAAKARIIDNLLLNIFITDDTSLTNEWTPIGSETHPFTGTFNGGGYNIAGVYVDGTKNQGLFGYVGEGGSVTNVIMLDGKIRGTENVGGVAGYNKGTVTYSCNDGIVEGQKAVGGICGYNVGTIQNSYNKGTVDCTYSGGSQIGGICGYNTRAQIRQCFNDGLVTGVADSNYYGGICGFNSGDGLYSCYNSGEVLGGFYVGGIIGYNSTGTTKYCLNFGIVNTLNSVNSNVNVFTGYNYGTCTVTNCYIDSTVEGGVINNLNGAVAKTTAQLTGYNASYSLGLESGRWTNKSDDTYFKYYPQIYDLYYSGCQKMRDDALESVRVVKEEFFLKLKIDGLSDTYYADFPSAISALGLRNGTIVPVRDVTVSSTVNIGSDVVISGEEFTKTVKRADGFTGAMFNVTGSLTVGDSKNGSDDDILLVIDGNQNVTAAQSLITLGEGAVLTTYPGAEITGAKATAKGSVVYMDMDSVMNIRGGRITNSTTTLDGGAIYNDMGTINMTGGTISGNQSSGAKAGAIYNNSGVVNMSGGVIEENYGKTLGGGFFSVGSDAEINISDSAVIRGNSANAGGGILVSSGTANMTGGTICENFAYKKHGSTATTGGGGGVTINSSGKFVMSGGTVRDNYVYNNVGSGFGIASFGTFEMSKDALVANNDILVGRNRTVCITEKLTAAGTAAVLTPYTSTTATTYDTTLPVLSGEAMGLSYRKFEITPMGTTEWHVNSAGYLMNTEIVNVASLSKFGAYAVDYVSVAQAVKAVAAGETGIITIIGDNTINETIKVYGDVTILSETDQTFTSMRGGSFTGALFEVQSGGTLRFGFTEAEAHGEDVSTDAESIFTTDSVGGEYILDGGYEYNQSTGTSLITVKSGGTLYTYDDFTMTNSYATSGGNINVSGDMLMYGGTFRNNTAANGGAINVASTGRVALLGGMITGNNVISGGRGKAIYCTGTLTRSENVYEYYQDEEIVATKNTYVTVTEDNDVYLNTGKTLAVDTVTTTVLLSGTSTAPESVFIAAQPMVISAPAYYSGMPVLSGSGVGMHYSEFSVSEDGYYITVNGTIGYNLLIAATYSGVKTDREENLVSGFNVSETVEDAAACFLNTDKIEFGTADGAVMQDNEYLRTGATVNLYTSDNTAIIDTLTVVIIGDVDCDGYIDGMDSVYISCIAEGMFDSGELTAAQLRAADVDGNGVIDQTDSQYVATCGIKINTVDQSI